MPEKGRTTPTVLVRRNVGGLVGPNGEDVTVLPSFGVISLFTGAGGMDIGCEAAGFATLVQHEWDECACATLIYNRPRYFRHAALIQGDIRQTPTSMLLRAAGLRVGDAHLVAGGPPCQGFSTANAKNAYPSIHDDRRDLVFEFLRVVDEAKPSFFVMENVSGFVSFNKNGYLKAFLKAAWESYYELVYGLVDCVEYGVPQYRCRFICMGTRRDRADNEGMIAGLPEPENLFKTDLEALKEARAMPLWHPGEEQALLQAPGIRYFPDRDVLIPPAPIRHGQDGGRSLKFQEFYRRLRAEEPDRIVEPPERRCRVARPGPVGTASEVVRP